MTTITPAHLPAWHRSDTLLQNESHDMTVREALAISGLDFEVMKVPIYGHFTPEPTDDDPKPSTRQVKVDGRWGVQRMDTGAILGAVGNTWHPVQNAEGFALIDEVMALAGAEAGGAWIESAMALDSGKKCVIITRLGDDLQIAGDDYASYLTFVNGHDGRTSVTALACDMRIWCSNMFNDLGNIAKDDRIFRVRHTRNATERVKEAAQILGMRNRRREQLALQGEYLADRGISDAQFDRFLRTLLPKGQSSSSETQAQTRRAGIAQIYHGADNLSALRGTRWGALQAVVEYADHGRQFKNFNVEMRAVLGLSPQPLQSAAWNILSQPSERFKEVVA